MWELEFSFSICSPLLITNQSMFSIEFSWICLKKFNIRIQMIVHNSQHFFRQYFRQINIILDIIYKISVILQNIYISIVTWVKRSSNWTDIWGNGCDDYTLRQLIYNLFFVYFSISNSKTNGFLRLHYSCPQMKHAKQKNAKFIYSIHLLKKLIIVGPPLDHSHHSYLSHHS